MQYHTHRIYYKTPSAEGQYTCSASSDSQARDMFRAYCVKYYGSPFGATFSHMERIQHLYRISR